MAFAVVASPIVAGVAVPATGGVVAQQATPSGFSGETNLSDAETTYLGEAANDTAGRSVSHAGDVNGDDVDDLLIGAPDNDSGGVNAGAAYIVYGPADPGNMSLTDANVTLVGESDSDRAGWSVSYAGDVNNDGLADVIVGAPGNDSTAQNAGAAYVVLGNESMASSLNLTDADVKLVGETEGDRVGWAVSNASGLDGPDGVAVGAPFQDDGTGAVYAVSGESLFGTVDLGTEATATLTGASAGDRAGRSLSHAGDVNDDGTADLIVGASNYSADNVPARAGAAHVVYGELAGMRNLSTANLTLTGVDASDRSGWSGSPTRTGRAGRSRTLVT